jgi:protein-disulfide isomerase
LSPSRWIALVCPLAAVTLTAATCNRGNPAGAGAVGAAAPSAPDANPFPAVDPAAEANAAQVLAGIPGMDFSILPPAAQRELSAVMTDEFCYCGCPHTLAACLKTHSGCKHARRMAKLAAGEAAAGMPATEISNELTKYYLAFKEPRQSFKIDPRQCVGAADAKVTVVEFSDFECPFCGAARPILEAFAKENSARVRFCMAPFPLAAHPNAIPAGQAALYARDQGKFWEMHDALFENQTTLSVDAIKQLGGKIGLNANEVGKVLAGQRYVEELNASKEAGKNAGVNATPTLYINGRKLELPLNGELLIHTVDDEMEWSANGSGWAAD